MCRYACAIALLCFVHAARAKAQEQTVPRVEIGPDVSFFQVPYSTLTTGAGGHVAIGVTRWLAIETRIRFFPEDMPPGLDEGGASLHVFAGPRATFVSRGRWTVAGVLLPGFVHFTNAVTHVGPDMDIQGSTTRFSIDMGADVGVRLARRWDAHLMWSGPLYTTRGATVTPDHPPDAPAYVEIVHPASVQATFQVSAGVSYRAGSLSVRPDAPGHGAWLVGGDIGSATYAPALAADMTTAARVGGFTSFPITTWMDGDAGVNVFLKNADRVHTPYDGGRIAQALGGVRLGRRVGRIGYFGKVRAGAQTHSQAVAPESRPGHPVVARNWRRALEFGAVIETAVHPHFVWRLDVGDVMAFHPRGDARPADHSIAITSGLAWRFGRTAP